MIPLRWAQPLTVDDTHRFFRLLQAQAVRERAANGTGLLAKVSKQSKGDDMTPLQPESTCDGYKQIGNNGFYRYLKRRL